MMKRFFVMRIVSSFSTGLYVGSPMLYYLIEGPLFVSLSRSQAQRSEKTQT